MSYVKEKYSTTYFITYYAFYTLLHYCSIWTILRSQRATWKVLFSRLTSSIYGLYQEVTRNICGRLLPVDYIS